MNIYNLEGIFIVGEAYVMNSPRDDNTMGNVRQHGDEARVKKDNTPTSVFFVYKGAIAREGMDLS